MAEEVKGVHSLGAGIYPKAQVLNRGIAKLIDLFIVAAAGQVFMPVGFLGGLAYILIADGFAGGRSIGKRLIGLQTVLSRSARGGRVSGIYYPQSALCGGSRSVCRSVCGMGCVGSDHCVRSSIDYRERTGPTSW